LQREGVKYFEADDHDDHAPAGQIDHVKLSLGHPGGGMANHLRNPMLFVGQTRLPENDVTRARLTWDTSLYLFWLRIEGRDHYKLVEQNVGEQSVDDHYAPEEELN
jgi:hypothetical protein